MDITCDKCKTVSSIPDAAIPDEGITFECPHCSAQLFAKLDNSQPEEDLFGTNSLSLDTGIDDLDNLEALDMDMSEESLSIDINQLNAEDISPSMLYNTEEMQNQENKPKLDKKIPPLKIKERKDINSQENSIPQEAIPSNTLNSYLNSRSASVQEQKTQISPLLIFLMALLIVGGASGYYFMFMKDKNLNKQIIMTPEIKQIIEKTYKDNPSDYKKALDNISNKLAQQPNHILYKTSYIYIAAKYFISIENIIESFAPDYDTYYKDIKKFKDKSAFIKKATIYYQLSKVLNKKSDIPNKLKIQINNIAVNDPDSLQLKAIIFYKNKDLEKLKKLVSASNLDSKKMLSTYFVLLKTEFMKNESISLTFNKIKEINPNHIHSIFLNIEYLLKYNQLDSVKKELRKTESIKKEMTSYELTQLYLLEARNAVLKLQLKEAYRFVKIAEDLKVKNDVFFKEILNFYYHNYYNSAALSMLKNTYQKNYSKDFKISKIYINLLIRDGDFGKAGQISTDLRNKYPKKPEVYYLSALLSNSLGNTVMAIDFLKKALSINNKYQDAVVLLSEEYIKKGKKAKAKLLLEDFIKDFKQNTLVKEGLALLYYKNKEFNKSLKLYNELLNEKEIKINKANLHFRINMIKFYTKKQSPKETLKNLYNIYKHSPNFKELRIEIAKLEIEIKNYDNAIKLLKLEVKIRTNSILANEYLGIAYYFKKNYDLAEDLLNKTLSLDGKNHLAFYYLGKTYQSLDKRNKALDAFSNAYSYNKKSYKYLIEVARTHIALNHASEAFEAYAKLIKIKPTFEALYEYGSLYLKENNNKQALKYFNLSYNINPENIKLILEMGNLFFKMQNLKKSLIFFKKAIKLDRKNAQAYYMIGEINRTKEKFKRAIPYYLKAIKLNPNEGKYYYQLGYMYKGMKKYKKSLKIFKTYLKKVPNSPDKAEIMDEIYDLEHI